MTAHVHDHASLADRDRSGPAADGHAATAPSRPRWLVPGLGIGLLAAALVVAGVLSFSTVIYAGLFGGMILMHLGGHGAHGGQAAHSGGNGEHGEATARDTEDLRQPSSGAQASASGSDDRLDDRALHRSQSNRDT